MVNSILILEDDFDLSQQWQVALESSAMDVRLVTDFEQAIEACKQQKFDALVVDVFLRNSDGVFSAEAGLTFLAALRTGLRDLPKWGAEVPILMVSGSNVVNSFDILELAKNLGGTDVLRKPFRPPRLVEQLHDMMANTSQ